MCKIQFESLDKFIFVSLNYANDLHHRYKAPSNLIKLIDV